MGFTLSLHSLEIRFFSASLQFLDDMSIHDMTN